MANGTECKYIDLNLFSGSADKLRNILGGYYQTVQIDIADMPISAESQIGDILEWVNPYGTLNDETTADQTVVLISREDSPIYKIAASTAQATSSSDQSLITKYMVPIRIYGNPDNVATDNEWRQFFIDDAETFSISDDFFDDYSFEREQPYSQYNANVLMSKGLDPLLAVDISYKYLSLIHI